MRDIDMAPQGPKWLALNCGDDEVGTGSITGCDNFHIVGRFRAGPGFPRYEGLLSRVYRLWETDAPEWIDSLEEVNDLHLYLLDPNTGEVTPIRDFQLEGLTRIRDAAGE